MKFHRGMAAALFAISILLTTPNHWRTRYWRTKVLWRTELHTPRTTSATGTTPTTTKATTTPPPLTTPTTATTSTTAATRTITAATTPPITATTTTTTTAAAITTTAATAPPPQPTNTKTTTAATTPPPALATLTTTKLTTTATTKTATTTTPPRPATTAPPRTTTKTTATFTCNESRPHIFPPAWPSETNLSMEIKAHVLAVPKTVEHYASGDVLADDGIFSLSIIARPKRICGFLKYPLKQVSTVFFMRSSPEEVVLREAIRTSWALDLKHIQRIYSAVYFVVGVAEDQAVNSEVMKEAREHQDVFVVNFRDTYRNLTLKTYSMLLLASRYCRDVQFVMTGDTDTLFLPGNIYGLLNQLSTEKWNKSIIGLCWSGAKPIRDPKNKWFVPKEAWPFEHFPVYCNGFASFLTKGVPDLLLEKVPSMTFIQSYYHEDVLFAGVLAMLAGVEHIHHPGFSVQRVVDLNPCDANMFAIHGPQGMRSEILAKQHYNQWKSKRMNCGYCV